MKKKMWNKIAEINEWPDPIFAKDVETLKGFPLSRGGFRNLLCGQTAVPELVRHSFHVGRYRAIRLAAVVNFLDQRTQGAEVNNAK